MNLKLEDILLLLESGSFGLPDFQRQFRWGADQVRSLLATVFMGWPAGLILLMEAPPTNFFAVRSLEGLQSMRTGPFRHLVLDGQQRMTALAQAFGLTRSSNDLAWYLDVALFELGFDTGEIEDAFIRQTSLVKSPEERLLIPLSSLRNAAEFQRWRDRTTSLIEDDHDRALSSYDRLNRLWVDLLGNAREFEFPCSVLTAEMPLPAVAAIFEKLNTAGLSLDTFDLVVAHVYKDGRNLRGVWEEELQLRPILRHFSPEDPQIAVELVAMVELGDTRRSGLLRLEADVLWNSWERAIAALEVAARFLTDRAGILNASQLPHRGILLVLAGAAYQLDGLPTSIEGLLLYWVYSRGLSERFNAAVNTRVVSEYKDLVNAARGEDLPKIRLNTSALAETTRRTNTSVFLTLQAMVRRLNPVDYPVGLIAVAISPEWAIPIPMVGGSDYTSPEPALGIVLGGPEAERILRGRTLKENRDNLLLQDSEQVHAFLETQLLPDLKSTAWVRPTQFLRNRAATLIDETNSMWRGAPEVSGREDESSADSEPTLDLIRTLLSKGGAQPAPPLRAVVGRRLAESLLDAGKPADAAAAIELLLEAGGPWSARERVELALIQARALNASGLQIESLRILERVRHDTSFGEAEGERGDLPSLVSAEIGAQLIRLNRAAEAIPVLQDALGLMSSQAAYPNVRAVVTLNLARCFSQLGDHASAAQIASELLEREGGRLAENNPALSAEAHLLASEG